MRQEAEAATTHELRPKQAAVPRESAALARAATLATTPRCSAPSPAAHASALAFVAAVLPNPASNGMIPSVSLSVGSSDPHGLKLDDDRAPRVPLRPTYSVGKHLEASDAELCSRALPELNSAAATTPPTPHATAASPPPSFGSVAEVIPKRTLSAVRTWYRRLRRCLRAAAKGEVRKARTLRPADLWLPAATNTLPAARGMVVDLRPLGRGERATPLARSDGVTCMPDSSLNLSEFCSSPTGVNAGFADCAILSEVSQGLSDDSECAFGTLLCAPHGSALARYDIVSGKLETSAVAGWASVEIDLPCWPLRTYPVGLVDESERAGRPKFRMTSDLSWPHPRAMPDGEGGYVDAVNAAMRRSAWPANRLMRVGEIAESAAVLASSGAPVALWGFDCCAYYRQHGRQLGELWRNAVATVNGTMLDRRCCFGSAADATKCSRVSNFIAWRVRRALADVDAAHPPT